MGAEKGYLDRMNDGGHFKGNLGQAAVALADVYCRADLGTRRALGKLLVKEVEVVFREVFGWPTHEARQAAANITHAFHRAPKIGEESGYG